MIIGRNFVFVCPPRSASTSIRWVLREYGVLTQNQHEPLRWNPPHPIVAAVNRPWGDVLESAWHMVGSPATFADWQTKKSGPNFPVAGRDIRDFTSNHTWLRYVTFKLRFDHLQEDWQAFCDAVGIKADLPHLNKRHE